MKSVTVLALVALASPALALPQGQERANSSMLTRELNRAPPAAAAPAPGTVTTRPLSQPAPATAAPTTVAPPAAASTAAAEAPPAAPPPAPAPTVLNAAALAALPFTMDLPAGTYVSEGRPGPDFHVWSIRKGDTTLAMVYAGPASQFPIYDGQLIQAAGRSSIVVTEEGRRMAMEHLFQRNTAPAEIHVWVASVEGADRALAEQIAQSVDPR